VGGPPPQPPPPSQVPPPPPGASREDWRRWKRQTRHLYWGGHWGWFWGVVLVLVGGYALLSNLGLLRWVRADVFWPLLLIALGAWLLIGRAFPGRPPR